MGSFGGSFGGYFEGVFWSLFEMAFPISLPPMSATFGRCPTAPKMHSRSQVSIIESPSFFSAP